MRLTQVEVLDSASFCRRYATSFEIWARQHLVINSKKPHTVMFLFPKSLFFSSGWLPSEMQRVHSENSSQSLGSGKIISCKWEDPENKWIVDGLEQT